MGCTMRGFRWSDGGSAAGGAGWFLVAYLGDGLACEPLAVSVAEPYQDLGEFPDLFFWCSGGDVPLECFSHEGYALRGNLQNY